MASSKYTPVYVDDTGVFVAPLTFSDNLFFVFLSSSYFAGHV